MRIFRRSGAAHARIRCFRQSHCICDPPPRWSSSGLRFSSRAPATSSSTQSESPSWVGTPHSHWSRLRADWRLYSTVYSVSATAASIQESTARAAPQSSNEKNTPECAGKGELRFCMFFWRTSMSGLWHPAPEAPSLWYRPPRRKGSSDAEAPSSLPCWACRRPLWSGPALENSRERRTKPIVWSDEAARRAVTVAPFQRGRVLTDGFFLIEAEWRVLF